KPLVHELAGSPEPLADSLPEGAEQTHEPEVAGGGGGSSRPWVTGPFPPRAGRAFPFRVTSTPPAFPMVTTKRRSVAHSRLAPAGSSSPTPRPSSVWTRIQLGSTALIPSRWGPEGPGSDFATGLG